ncbi:beta-glucosidase [Streptomyces sulfonofaciens]|uniref:Beta-glucosidase n=1 Tax=Streptomyces sulfonofaciens TaxID=68272 RepID=A0A919GHV1_9ACTN|nr:glycoside hydrolase family 3 C-terminal domain-containing protein [Streptomyces sulfonofaciens]GHH84255.1 beta-glucosidase [Streptomyces sulfonofaciens]
MAQTAADQAREAVVEAALGGLDLDGKTRMLAGQDMWSMPALPEIGLGSMVLSDGPIGVRGVRLTADDPSVALPSPTALAASWDQDLARRVGRLLAQEARRKGVHLLLAPTLNLQRTPLGGRHFEAYSEDPYLTGVIGTGYVQGVQSGGVGAVVKHFVANDAETDRFTVNGVLSDRTLREVYLAPFEAVVASARPWGLMTAYNAVNGTTMSEHRELVEGVLRGEWGFDGVNVSDWAAARSTAGALAGGLDVTMPGPETVYGAALAAAVRSGEVEEAAVDRAVRRVLRLAARVGVLAGAVPAVPAGDLPPDVDGRALAREAARRGFVLLRNALLPGPCVPGALAPGEGSEPGAARRALPLDPARLRRVALIGAAARDPRAQGGGSATVFPDHVVSPLDGFTAALPDGAVSWSLGVDLAEELSTADQGFELRAVCRNARGTVLGGCPLPTGKLQWIGDSLPDGVTSEALHSIEITGTFTPRESGDHLLGTRGVGAFRLRVGDRVVYEGVQRSDGSPDDHSMFGVPLGDARVSLTMVYESAEESSAPSDPFESLFGAPVERASVPLTAGEPVEISLLNTLDKGYVPPLPGVTFSLLHRPPRRPADELIAEATEAAAAADAAVVVVATTERVESEGFDRVDLALPGRQDDLVRAVAAANPHTVVVVNAGSPVELPWREEVAAVLLSWFPGQEGGAALADVLLGAAEPGGRLPTTWGALRDAPVTEVTPVDGDLRYREGVFVGYRAWQRAGRAPVYPFGHGLGYTDWTYESIAVTDTTATVRLRNTGQRPGREVVQVYVGPVDRGEGEAERPARVLAGFAGVEAAPGRSVEVAVELHPRAFETWDEPSGGWAAMKGAYTVQAGRSVADLRVTTVLEL